MSKKVRRDFHFRILKPLFVIIATFLFFQEISAQRISANQATFLETTDQAGIYRFHFDSHYYLNERDCQYVQIIRTSAFDFEQQQYHGQFVDHDIYGRKLLEGQYENFQKEGEFIAYHTTGHIKWTGEYHDDTPAGAWSYFYPDGKPMLHLKIQENGIYIQDFFDTRGRQRVKSGNGSYEMKIEIEPFNEFGAKYLLKKGRIRNGKPVGYWNVFLSYEDGKQEYLTMENYKDGFARVLDLIDEEDIWGAAVGTILPVNWFVNAENLNFKPCNIDAQSGYLNYLIHQLEASLQNTWTDGLQPQWAEFQVDVRADGIPKNVRTPEPHVDPNIQRRLEIALKQIPYWIPSYLTDRFIDDLLTVRVLVGQYLDTTDAVIQDINIQREKGI